MSDQTNQPVFESLEGRTLQSVSLANGVLTITGTDANDSATLSRGSGASAVTLSVTDNRKLTKFAADSVNLIRYNGLAGNDRLEIGRGPIGIPIEAHGGNGNDLLIGSDRND